MFEFVKQLFNQTTKNDLLVNDASLIEPDFASKKLKKPMPEDYFYNSQLSDNTKIEELSYEDYMQIDKLHQKN